MASCTVALACRGVLAGPDSEAATTIDGPRDLFDLRGIDQSHFDQLTDHEAWQEGENEVLLKIMYRLYRDFPMANVESWSRGAPDPAGLAEAPDRFRGEIFRLAGRLTRVEVVRPAAEVARKFELNEYYRCRFLLGSGEPAEVFARQIPNAWKRGRPIDHRAGAYAVFVKEAGNASEEPLPVFAASRVEWYPPTMLGDLGMDAGLFDALRAKSPIEQGFFPMVYVVLTQGWASCSAGAPVWGVFSTFFGLVAQCCTGETEPSHLGLTDLRLTHRGRECFYQLMAAAGRSKPGELIEAASEKLARAGEKRFSVVPLFNEPLTQLGRLVVLSGTARQIIPVRVADKDVLSRFGIDRYYQVLLFTADSQDNPIVFLLRELPEGMPIGGGGEFAEPVTAAGFFFNKWAYQSRQPKWQLAPLLIGRDLERRRPEESARNPLIGTVAGGLFVLGLLGVWLAIWRYTRRDKELREKMIRRRAASDPIEPP
ncbi:MAG: hypothetical protein ACYTG0_10685 [Planctomycetota bacterium]